MCQIYLQFQNVRNFGNFILFFFSIKKLLLTLCLCLYNSFFFPSIHSDHYSKQIKERSYRTFPQESFPSLLAVLSNMSWYLLLLLTYVSGEEQAEQPSQVRQFNSPVRCYIGTTFNPTQGSFTQSTSTCPDYSSGCIKRTICKNLKIRIEDLNEFYFDR